MITEFIGTHSDGLDKMPSSSSLLGLGAYRSDSCLRHSPVPQPGGGKDSGSSPTGQEPTGKSQFHRKPSAFRKRKWILGTETKQTSTTRGSSLGHLETLGPEKETE